ncbi:hypothetical protein HPP92_008004 [Vanilla planifolia]|uniref:H15 domain-containing protein n=1 Tax=Vanilla planifolia TaxID=51239 RepID=A0A835REX8_VANPL|nr:hypothetical protein HPP92_008004 [Vanilla planifolia]
MASRKDEINPVSHPSYPEMILAALGSLAEKDGSNKTAILNYIEANYGESLPEDHAAELSDALAEMKENGQLLFLKNNYLKPDSILTPRRGRGRPPKPKTPLVPGAVSLTPRPRGRPPKPKDPLAAAVAKASSGLPRPRGRPKKHRPTVRTTLHGVAGPVVSGVKRGRGRPPKVRANAAE